MKENVKYPPMLLTLGGKWPYAVATTMSKQTRLQVFPRAEGAWSSSGGTYTCLRSKQ